MMPALDANSSVYTSLKDCLFLLYHNYLLMGWNIWSVFDPIMLIHAGKESRLQELSDKSDDMFDYEASLLE